MRTARARSARPAAPVFSPGATHDPLFQNGQDIPADEVLVTKLLADAGYVGGLSGKLHPSACNPAVTAGRTAH
ncbi:MAG: hypothetical protein R2854_01455 [Caldilineaceae bacterium]